MPNQIGHGYRAKYSRYTLVVWEEHDGWHWKVEQPADVHIPGLPKVLTFEGPTRFEEPEDAKIEAAKAAGIKAGTLSGSTTLKEIYNTISWESYLPDSAND
jgi:hypothetical protein